MSAPALRTLGVLSLAALVAACGTTLVVPEAPAALKPPAGQQLFLEALASGVQIYECASKANAPGVYEWVFRAPEALLTDRAGRMLGKHYAGPTWEALDGSLVVGSVTARDNGWTATAIPWLLLSATSSRGDGMFKGTASIQRLQTVAGIAPTTACGAANAKEIARVPYTATYYFYR